MSRNDVLIDAEWVEGHLDDPSVVLVEVDEDTSAYEKGHIRGAVRLDWKADLQDPVKRDFVDKPAFELLLSERGIGNDQTVVLYGGNNNWFAAYAYWYFKLYGHDAVKLLDGGRKKWELESRELVQDVPERAKTSYTAKEQNLDIRAFRAGRTRSHRQPEPRRRSFSRRVQRALARASALAAGTVAAPGPCPVRGQHPVVEGRQRRRHVPFRRRAEDPVRRCGRRPRQGHHRVLPNWRAFGAHMVCVARAARAAER